MDLKKSTDEELDEVCRVVYEKLYGTGSKGIEPFITGISDELKERGISHATSKKCLDKHRDKYFKIDVFIPTLDRFIMLKHRKHITRADMNQFRHQESSVGIKGLMVNFFSGVDVHESTTLLPGEEKREMLKQNAKLRGIAAARSSNKSSNKSSSVGRLPGISDRRFKPSRSWGGSSNMMAGDTSSSSTAATTVNTNVDTTPAIADIDFDRIFAASCASFFISEGDRITFASAFNDFLSQMSIKRISFPRKLLNGDLLQKPDGVFNENLEYYFKTSSIASTVRKKTPDEDDDEPESKPGSGFSDTRRSEISSSKYRKLPAIGSTPSPPKDPSFRVAALGPSTYKKPVVIDPGKAFAVACAAFFFGEGDNEMYILTFNDMLKAMSIGNQYGLKYNYYHGIRRAGGDQEITENVDDLRLPSKKIIKRIQLMLIGEIEIEDEDEQQEEQIEEEGEGGEEQPEDGKENEEVVVEKKDEEEEKEKEKEEEEEEKEKEEEEKEGQEQEQEKEEEKKEKKEEEKEEEKEEAEEKEEEEQQQEEETEEKQQEEEKEAEQQQQDVEKRLEEEKEEEKESGIGTEKNSVESSETVNLEDED